jgi:hypothetical protein
MAAPREEDFLPFPAPTKAQVPLATQFRSTWLTSSLRALREHRRFDEYMALLPPHHRPAVTDSVAGVWLPIEVAMAHYDACDALHFSPAELFAIGREVHTTAQASVLGTLTKLAVGAGATPWTAMGQYQRLWDRVWVGGGVGVFKLGPKEARVEIVGWPCSRYTYIRHAMRGVMAGMLELFCTKAYVSEVPRLCTSTTLAFRCAWA